MTTPSQLQSLSPIGETNPLQMPVADVAQAVAFYTEKLGFTASETREGPPKSVTLTRDSVTLGLAENGGDPEQASCYIAVDDLEGLQREYEEKDTHVSKIELMEHDGTQYQVFWLKDLDGICYCLGRQTEANRTAD